METLRKYLWGLSAAEITFDSLSDKLKQRFWNAGQTAKYRAELRARRRGKSESLQNLYQDIRRLLVLAYPGDSSLSAEAIAMESFLQALDDKEFELRLSEKEPESLDEIFRHALRLEANDRAISSRHDSKRTGGNQVRSLVSDNSLDQISAKLEQVMTNQQRSENNLKRLESEYKQLKSKVESTQPVHGGSVTSTGENEFTGGSVPCKSFHGNRRHVRQPNFGQCFNCGEPGHHAVNCPAPRSGSVGRHTVREKETYRLEIRQRTRTETIQIKLPVMWVELKDTLGMDVKYILPCC